MRCVTVLGVPRERFDARRGQRYGVAVAEIAAPST